MVKLGCSQTRVIVMVIDCEQIDVFKERKGGEFQLSWQVYEMGGILLTCRKSDSMFKKTKFGASKKADAAGWKSTLGSVLSQVKLKLETVA